jgi:hypothetical protein
MENEPSSTRVTAMSKSMYVYGPKLDKDAPGTFANKELYLEQETAELPV